MFTNELNKRERKKIKDKRQKAKETLIVTPLYEAERGRG
jgi:hypothetical protein